MDNLPIVKKNGAGVENTPLDGLAVRHESRSVSGVFIQSARWRAQLV